MAGMPLFAHAAREKLTRSAGGGQRAGGAEELRSNRRLLVDVDVDVDMDVDKHNGVL